MQTDQVQVALRPRSGLEAVDLGFAMVRHWWRPLLSTWLVLVLPVAVALCVTLRETPLWAIFALWWLRPVFGRVPLHVLSRTIFSEPTGLVETARALPSLLRSGLLTSLSSQRLSPGRTFLLPVLQLEGLRGRARRERCAALARRDLGASLGLLVVGAVMNGSIMLGLLLITQVLVPDAVDWRFFDPLLWADADTGAPLAAPYLYLAGVSVVEPLLGAGGFALYLNRRVYLEGWDIDLAFRQLARRASGPVARATRAAALAGVALLLASGPARAECQPEDPISAAACIEAVFDGADFGSVEERERWRLRDFGGDEEEEDSLAVPWPAWLANLLATGLELTLWVGLAVLGVALLAALSRKVEPHPLRGEAPAAPASLFGLDLDPAALPDDVVAAARARWQAGGRIEALSLLYRGALVHLTEREALEIPGSATELECVGLVQRSRVGEGAAVFAELTAAWLAARYAAAPPAPEDFDHLCQRFAPAFGGTG